MKIVPTSILCVFILLLSFSCGQGENANVKTEIKQEAVKEVKSKNGVKSRTAKQRSMPANRGEKKDYWASLEKDLNIDKAKIKQLIAVNAKNNSLVRSLKEEKKDGYMEQIKEIRLSEKEQIKKILGDELYQKKLEWDKKGWSGIPAPGSFGKR